MKEFFLTLVYLGGLVAVLSQYDGHPMSVGDTIKASIQAACWPAVITTHYVEKLENK